MTFHCSDRNINLPIYEGSVLTASKTTIRIPPTTLNDLKHFLLREGFHHTRWQHRLPGQVFGLVKRLNYKKQLHIRAFIDGTLKAEEEIWRFLFPLHLIIRPKFENAIKKLQKLLKKYLTTSLPTQHI